MARATPGRSPTRGLRFFQDEAGGGSGGGDSGSGSGDGGGDIFLAQSGLTVFPAVYNNGGVVADVSYIMTAGGPFTALFAAAGFASESGFIANVAGVATPGVTFLTSTSVLGALPLGTAENFSTLTKDGVTNLSRWLVRLGP